MATKLEENEVLDTYGDIQLKSDCVMLHDGEYAHRDDCTYNCSDDEYYLTDEIDEYNIVYCENYEEYYNSDDCMFGALSSGGEGYFHSNSDYCYSEYSDRYFQDSYAAGDCEHGWCERRDDWVPFDVLEGEEETWDCKGNDAHLGKTFNSTYGMKYTFGVEIETCDGYLEFDGGLNLACVEDGSIEGKEYVTGVLKGDQGIRMLKKICHAIASNCYVDKTCGVHVHIGGAHFNRRFSILSIMLGTLMQDELYETLPKSRRSNTYCKVIPDKFKELRTVNKRLYPFTHRHMLRLLADYVYNKRVDFDKNNCKKSRHPNGHYANTRYYWLNLNNCNYRARGETVEFRQHSASMEFNKIYNWLLFCMCYVNYIENHSRKIIDAYNARIDNPDTTVSMYDVLLCGVGQHKAAVLMEYFNSRKDKFA